MSNTFTSDSILWIIFGGIVLGILGFIGWVIKQSIYAPIDKIEKRADLLVTLDFCKQSREIMSKEITLKFETIYSKVHDQVSLIQLAIANMDKTTIATEKKLDSLISRLDEHINRR